MNKYIYITKTIQTCLSLKLCPRLLFMWLLTLAMIQNIDFGNYPLTAFTLMMTFNSQLATFILSALIWMLVDIIQMAKIN